MTAWFVAKTNDRSLFWSHRKMYEGTDTKVPRSPYLPAFLIWGKDLNFNAIPNPTETMWVGGGDLQHVALMRTSWTDPNAIWVAVKGGKPNQSHGHMDVGSFEMEIDGVQWALDLGKEDYGAAESNVPDFNKKNKDSGRWSIFRYGIESHNTINLDRRRQRVNPLATISATQSTNLMKAVVNMSETYSSDLLSAVRTIQIENKRNVVVMDEVKTGATEREIQWIMVSPETVQIADLEAEISKDNKKLMMSVSVDNPNVKNLRLSTWTTEPPNAWERKNPGTIRVGYVATVPRKTTATFKVSFNPMRAKPTGP